MDKLILSFVLIRKNIFCKVDVVKQDSFLFDLIETFLTGGVKRCVEFELVGAVKEVAEGLLLL